MRQSWEKIIDAGNAATSPLNSGKIDARQVYALSLVMTSTDNGNAGTVKLQGSNDICAFGNVAAAFTPAANSWVDIPTAMIDGSGTVAAGATVTLVVKQLCYAWVRAVWTPSAGAGTITAVVNTQGF
jgi:hypothetical protein